VPAAAASTKRAIIVAIILVMAFSSHPMTRLAVEVSSLNCRAANAVG
jgi:hypothetical protein